MSQQPAFEDDTFDDPDPGLQGFDGLLPAESSLLTAGWSDSDQMRSCLEREVLRQRVLANFGLRGGDRVSSRLDRQIDQATELVLDNAAPDFIYAVYPMDASDGSIRIAGHVTFESQALLTGLGWCRQAVAYVSTLGPDVDDVIDAAMEERPDFGLVVDTVASEAAEFLVDEVEQALSDRLPPHQAVSLAFSPGYCDWPVTDQAKLFSLLPDRPVGVSLLPTSLMTPRKSIAGLLGVGHSAMLNDTCNPCKTCTRRCDHRRHRGARV